MGKPKLEPGRAYTISGFNADGSPIWKESAQRRLPVGAKELYGVAPYKDAPAGTPLVPQFPTTHAVSPPRTRDEKNDTGADLSPANRAPEALRPKEKP